MPPELDTVSRSESLVETGFEYVPNEPVRVRVVHREHRTLVTDEGVAFQKAGRPRKWDAAARRVGTELNVNISRHGVVSLPVVRVGPPEAEVIRRIGEASVALYQELLELSD